MTNSKEVEPDGIRYSGFVINSAFDIRCSTLRAARAFTLIELVVVVGIITVLAGLVLSTAGYARKKAATTRTGAEIAVLSAALENYKADNGTYPRDNTTNQYTDTLDARQNFDPTQAVYTNASSYLYTQLSGDISGNRSPTGKSYMAFKPNMLLPAGGSGTVTAISDPFGNSYGYSTANQADPVTPKGYNPTFDLWSTAGVAPSPTPNPPATQQDLWIKNW
jgi:prepilin-type N-terminal cleavage/methylation domain-containing protein